jgi:invasion protein IalB
MRCGWAEITNIGTWSNATFCYSMLCGAKLPEFDDMKMLGLLAIGAVLIQVSEVGAQTPVPIPPQKAAKRVQAQAAVPKPASNPDKPAAGDQEADLTTATFGDWQLRCQKAGAGQPTQRNCEVIQSLIIQGQTAPFAQLGFARLAPNEPLYFTAVVPTNVTFPSIVRIAIDEKDAQPVEIAWTRCLPAGCFASLALQDDLLKRWHAQNEGGRLTFKNGAGQDMTLPFSFRGLARALDALGK